MATLQSGKSPGKRVEVGDKVLFGVNAVDTTSIAGRVASFKKAHLQYTSAELAVRKASQALRNQQAIVFEADVELNVAVEALAIALPNDGFPRQNPFRVLGSPAPGVIKEMGIAGGATEVIALEKVVLRHPGVSVKTVEAAKAAGDAARKVLEAIKPLVKLEKTRANAIAQRDAFAPGWDKAFVSLKLAAKAADVDGHAGIFAALFDRPALAKKSGAAMRKPVEPDAAPVSAPPSA